MTRSLRLARGSGPSLPRCTPIAGRARRLTLPRAECILCNRIYRLSGRGGATMAKLRQVGNSLVVTIPAALAKQYGLGVGDEVEIEPDGDALRLVPMLRVPKHR